MTKPPCVATPLKVVCEKIQTALGEVIAGSVIGKCVRIVFGAKAKNLQNSNRVRCYYGIRFVAGDVDEGEDIGQPSRQDPDFAEVDREEKNCSELVPESIRYRKAINLYRNERMEREKLQDSLDKEREFSKYGKTLQLPCSIFLNEDELVEVPGSKKHSGTFGCCCLSTYRGMDVAVKVYNELEGFSDSALKRIVLKDKEANVLLNLHSNKRIQKLLGVIIEKKPYQLVTSFHGINRE